MDFVMVTSLRIEPLEKPEETQMDGLEKCVYQKLIWNNIYSTV